MLSKKQEKERIHSSFFSNTDIEKKEKERRFFVVLSVEVSNIQLIKSLY